MADETRGLAIWLQVCATKIVFPALGIAPSRVPWYLGREKIMCISEPKSDSPNTLRKGHDQPAATSVHGWRYHHIGIPTDVPRPGEYYLEQFKMYVSRV